MDLQKERLQRPMACVHTPLPFGTDTIRMKLSQWALELKPQNYCPGSTRYWPTSKGTSEGYTKGCIISICSVILTNSATVITVDSGRTSFSAGFSMLACVLRR